MVGLVPPALRRAVQAHPAAQALRQAQVQVALRQAQAQVALRRTQVLLQVLLVHPVVHQAHPPVARVLQAAQVHLAAPALLQVQVAPVRLAALVAV